MNLLFYVSGHGYGHAVRSAEVVRELAAQQRAETIYVRTTAPAHLFAGMQGTAVQVTSAALDTGAVEVNPLQIDSEQTLLTAARFLESRDAILASEREFVEKQNIALIVADIPYLAG